MTLRRLLAISHESTRTGAPIVLAGFLEWIREHTDVEVHTILLSGGPMLERFEEIGGVTLLDGSTPALMSVMAERGLARLGSRRLAPALAAARIVPQTRRIGDVDLVYANSFTSVEVLPHLRLDAPVVAHVHELPFALRSYPHPDGLAVLRDAPDAWIAVCEEVRTMLTGLVGAPADRVQVHHPFVDAAAITSRAIPANDLVRLRKRMGIPAGAGVTGEPAFLPRRLA